MDYLDPYQPPGKAEQPALQQHAAPNNAVPTVDGVWKASTTMEARVELRGSHRDVTDFQKATQLKLDLGLFRVLVPANAEEVSPPILANYSEDWPIQCSERESGDRSSVHINHGSILKKQNEDVEEKMDSPTSPSIPAVGSGAGYPFSQEKHAHPPLIPSTFYTYMPSNTIHCNAPRPRNNILLPSSVEADEEIELTPLTCKSERNRWEDKETEMVSKRERSDVDQDQKQTPVMPFIKRSSSTVDEESLSERRIKRGRLSSPFPSGEIMETEDESEIGSHPPFQPQHVSIPRPGFSCRTGLQADTSDDDTTDSAGGRSSCMTTVYRQQSWKGKIVQEKEVKKSRGRPGTKFLVEWKSSWIDGDYRVAPELMQTWRDRKKLEKKSSQCSR